MVPFGRWRRSPERTARGPSAWHVWLVSMAPCGEAWVVPDACLLKYPAWARVAGSLRGLESNPGDFADLRGVVVGHAVQEECGVSGVGCLYLVPYGISIVGHATQMARVGMEMGQPPYAAHALVTAHVARWRAVGGCVRWSA